MSPAAMYSLATSTIRSYSAGATFEDGHTVSGPAWTSGGACASGASSASTTAERRSLARLSAASALTPLSGRTGDLEKRRHRGFEVGNKRGPHDLSLASRVALGKRGRLRLDLHCKVSLCRRRLRR